jgi:hypothetical protein
MSGQRWALFARECASHKAQAPAGQDPYPNPC